MVFGKIKDIIKKRQEESRQREATSTGFKSVEDYNKWKTETRIKARERIAHISQKKKKQKLKDKIEKNESNRNKSTLEVYVDVFDKVGKGVDKFQKGVDKFQKGIDQLERGTTKSTSKRKSRRTRKPASVKQNDFDGFGDYGGEIGGFGDYGGEIGGFGDYGGEIGGFGDYGGEIGGFGDYGKDQSKKRNNSKSKRKKKNDNPFWY